MDFYLRRAARRMTIVPNRFAKGGEAEIYGIPGRGDQSVKVYPDKTRPTDLEPRLEHMIDHPPPTIVDRLAWPLDLVEDDRGAVVGYLQPWFGSPYVTLAQALDTVQPPAWVTAAELHRIACEIALLLAELHMADYLYPDIHPGQFLCAAGQPTVAIDMAACHFEVAGEVFTCQRARDEYQPPELLAANDRIAAIDQRDSHGDDWSLAVVLFQITMGCLPFQGTHTGSGSDPTLIERIVQGIFPFDKNCRRFRPPPAASSYRDVMPELCDLFHACFVDGHAAQHRSSRPTAGQWTDALRHCAALRAVSVVPSSPPPVSPTLSPDRRPVLVTAGCVAAVALAAAAFQLGRWQASAHNQPGVFNGHDHRSSSSDGRSLGDTPSAETILDRYRHPSPLKPRR